MTVAPALPNLVFEYDRTTVFSPIVVRSGITENVMSDVSATACEPSANVTVATALPQKSV